MNYDKVCIQTFLEKQGKLFPEVVAATPEEAADFLEMMMAVVVKNERELIAYLEDSGVDLTGIKKSELKNLEEVFPLPDGRFLILEI